MRRAPALLLLAAPLTIGAASPTLVPDVSDQRIDIAYSFTGADLLLFGAILYPGGRAPRSRIDIAVVVKGPVEPILLRQKEKVAGIWMNAASARFLSAPSFYAVASSRPIAAMVDRKTAAIYELGLDNLQLSPAAGATPEEERRFDDGLVDLRRRAGLYAESGAGVTISHDVLYKARIAIPARVPVGNYTAETFLIEDGRVVAGAEREIAIGKSGFERFVATAAESWSLAYGLVAVALALGLGWAAAALFGRR